MTTSQQLPPYREQRQADGSIAMHIHLPRFRQHFGRTWKRWLSTFETLWRDELIVSGVDDEGAA